MTDKKRGNCPLVPCVVKYHGTKVSSKVNTQSLNNPISKQYYSSYTCNNLSYNLTNVSHSNVDIFNKGGFSDSSPKHTKDLNLFLFSLFSLGVLKTVILHKTVKKSYAQYTRFCIPPVKLFMQSDQKKSLQSKSRRF